MKSKKTGSKNPATKGAPAGSDGNPLKRLESQRISDDIAAYERSGGKVEKLGVTRVLQTVAPAAKDEVPRVQPVVRKRGR